MRAIASVGFFNRGFSLIEVTVVVAISSVLILTAATIFTMNANQNALVQSNADTTQIRLEIQSLISNSSTCAKALGVVGGLSPTLINTAVNTTSPVIFYEQDAVTPRYGAGVNKTYGANHELSVTTLNFVNTSGPVTTETGGSSLLFVMGNLELTINNASFPNAIKVYDVPITLEVDTSKAKAIVACSATNADAFNQVSVPACNPGQYLVFNANGTSEQWSCAAVP
jgi:prepilin-type N-terminal cleavage/methylation domain-containing protein